MSTFYHSFQTYSSLTILKSQINHTINLTMPLTRNLSPEATNLCLPNVTSLYNTITKVFSTRVLNARVLNFAPWQIVFLLETQLTKQGYPGKNPFFTVGQIHSLVGFTHQIGSKNGFCRGRQFTPTNKISRVTCGG